MWQFLQLQKRLQLRFWWSCNQLQRSQLAGIDEFLERAKLENLISFRLRKRFCCHVVVKTGLMIPLTTLKTSCGQWRRIDWQCLLSSQRELWRTSWEPNIWHIYWGEWDNWFVECWWGNARKFDWGQKHPLLQKATSRFTARGSWGCWRVSWNLLC